MNYDEARELASGGWHWTTKRDGVVRTAAPCIRYIGPPHDLTKPLPSYDPAQWESCEPHPDRESAERHYYEYSLDELKLDKYSNWHDCAVCGEPTKAGLSNRGLALWFTSPIMLCAEHLSREEVAKLRPFSPGPSVMHS